MPNMPPDSKLTELGERILLTLWKMRGIGTNSIKEEALKTELAVEGPLQDLTEEITNLNNQGFLEVDSVQGNRAVSLTALGLSVLRQIEEDMLQELK